MTCVTHERNDGATGHHPGVAHEEESNSFGPESRAAARGAAFTLMEVMIAAAILTLGLVGILALFPVAIRAGRQVVEDSNAVVIAQSVAESIREGIRNRKRSELRNGVIHTYFVFQHDGVMNPIPVDPSLEKPHHDYYILLPRYPQNRSYRSPEVALQAAKVFVYPEIELDKQPNGRGDAFLADDDGDDDGDRDLSTLRVEKTYRLGTLFPDENADSSNARVLQDQQIEVLRQYSYAFAIHASYFDADLREGSGFEPANSLYHVRVMVFRGFEYDPETTSGMDPPEPVYELDFEVSL